MNFAGKLRRQTVVVVETLVNSMDPEDTWEIAPNRSAFLDQLEQELREEHGALVLCPGVPRSSYDQVRGYFLEASENDAIDALQRLLQDYVDFCIRIPLPRCIETLYPLAVDKLNRFLRQENCALQIDLNTGTILKSESEFLQQDVIRPTLDVLRHPEYEASNQCFQKVLKDYRHGDYWEALDFCSKTFESTMKLICRQRGWVVAGNATARPLIRVCLENDLVPRYWQNYLDGLTNVIDGCIPTITNRESRHGPDKVREIPEYLAAFVLHMTGATVLCFTGANTQIAHDISKDPSAS